MSKTLKGAIRKFLTAWGSSVEARYKAATIYADAKNKWETYAASVFKGLDGFHSWTPPQWNLFYHIGNNKIAKCFLDFKRPSLPLTMWRLGLTVEEQQQIFDHGLFLADITGRVKCIQIRHLQPKHIEQVWDEEGNKRTILQQIKWLQDHQRSNIEACADGSLFVHHGCYIDIDTLAKLLASKGYPLDDLYDRIEEAGR